MGVFMLGYSILRIVVERYRQPDEPIGLICNIFSMGQLLSAPMLLLGVYLLLKVNKKPEDRD